MEVLSPFPQETPEAHDHRPCSSESEKNPDPLDHFLHSGPQQQTGAKSEVQQHNFQRLVEGVQGEVEEPGHRNQDPEKPIHHTYPRSLHSKESLYPSKTPVVQRGLVGTVEVDPVENS